jgi:photosystem II stability/assembly factor-like uncharacterized protein
MPAIAGPRGPGPRVQAAVLLLLGLFGLGTACRPETDVQSGMLVEGSRDGRIVVLWYDPGRNRLLKAHARELYESGDGGESWSAIPLPAAVLRGQIAAVQAAAGGEGALYVAGLGFGVLRSTDDGRTWRSLNAKLPSLNVEVFATHAVADAILYVGVSGDGLLSSSDGGATWRTADEGPGEAITRLAHTFTAGTSNTGWVYAATSSGVLRTMDCFCGWQPTGGLPAGGATAIAFDPAHPEQLYALADGSIHFSPDGGLNWHPLTATPPATVAIAVAPGGVIYAAIADGSTGRSLDGGATWKRTRSLSE